MAAISAAQVKELRERTGLGMMECKKALVAADGDMELAVSNLRKSSGLKAAKKAGRIASEGVVVTRIRPDGCRALILEVNSETDFVARDASFLAFVEQVADTALDSEAATVEELMRAHPELEAARQALVQKIGENIGVRRLARIETAGRVGSYVHSNRRLAALAELAGGSEELAREVAMHIAAVNPRVVRPADMPVAVLDEERAIFAAQAAESGKPPTIVEKMVAGRMRKFLAENSLTEQPFVKDPETTVGRLLAAGGAEINAFVRFEVGEGIEKVEEDFAAEVARQVAGAGA
ncbi:MAG: elongation factor Ts [Cellvibrionales bacterium]|nr:elongation factor Ts [Cellvibrionales bacterium]